jgi:predicted nucleic acid-binding protein
VKYLLDINVLIALAHTLHTEHARAYAWFAQASPTALGLCSITELGFVRISVQSGLQPDVVSALRTLASLKKSAPFELWPDALGADVMPAYVKRPAELTDGHLIELAKANNAMLATFDSGIKDAAAFLIS